MPTLEELAIGTRVRLTSGATGVLIYRSFARARVQLDRGRIRKFDVEEPDPEAEGKVRVRHVVVESAVFRDLAPAAEVDLLEGEGSEEGKMSENIEETEESAAETAAGPVKAAKGKQREAAAPEAPAVDVAARLRAAEEEATARGHAIGAWRYELPFGAMHARWLGGCKKCGAGLTVHEAPDALAYGGTALKQDCGKATRPAEEKKGKRGRKPAPAPSTAEAGAAAATTASGNNRLEKSMSKSKAATKTARAPEKKKTGSRRAAAARVEGRVFDEFRVTEVARFLGKHGLTAEQASAALKSVGVAMTPDQLTVHLRTRAFTKFPVAKLSKDQAAKLLRFKK